MCFLSVLCLCLFSAADSSLVKPHSSSCRRMGVEMKQLPLKGAQNFIGRSAKLAVSCAAAGAILRSESWRPMYFIGGGLANGVLSKTLKAIIRQPRPSASKKKGFGMPSSHAQSLFYFASILLFLGIYPPSSSFPFDGNYGKIASSRSTLSPLIGLLSLLYAIIASSYRVTSQLHTILQTFAGAITGTIMACIVYKYESSVMNTLLASSSSSSPSLTVRTCFILLSAAFLFRKEVTKIVETLLQGTKDVS